MKAHLSFIFLVVFVGVLSGEAKPKDDWVANEVHDIEEILTEGVDDVQKTVKEQIRNLETSAKHMYEHEKGNLTSIADYIKSTINVSNPKYNIFCG